MKESAPFGSNLLRYLEVSPNTEHAQTRTGRPTTIPSSSSSHEDVVPLSLLLAASYRTRQSRLETPIASTEYFWHELGVARLDDIFTWLWMAGRPVAPRALTDQKVMGREIVVTERMDMHLVWSNTRVFVKPLPRFLLEPRFWTEHVSCKEACKCSPTTSGSSGQRAECEESLLRKCALGFLMSYAALVCHESDLYIAQETHLLSDRIPWSGWKSFVKDVLEHESIYEHIDNRCLYGELRLSRLNAIYRITGRSVLRGYQPEYNNYSRFFRENFTWLASVLACIVVLLTAMQVGLATRNLQESEAFQVVCYGFTVFAIVGSLALVALILSVFLIVFVYNWIRTVQYVKARLLESGLSGRNAGA